MKNLKAEIKEIIYDMVEKKGKEISDGADLFAEGILDSLNMVRLVIALQSEFEIEIPFEELIPQNLWNIDVIVNLINKHSKKL